MFWHGSNVSAQHVADGPAALLHRGAGQRRKADDVAHGVDVRHRGLEILVAPESAAFVGLQPGAVECRALGIADAADAEQHRFAEQPLAAFQLDGDQARLAARECRPRFRPAGRPCPASGHGTAACR